MGIQRLRKDYNQLEALLAEALQSELNQRRGKGAISRLKSIDEILHQTYANPDNWDAKGIVCVTYVDPSTSETQSIGVFQEFVHRRTAARKLERVVSDEQSTCLSANSNSRIEYFTDQFLVAAKEDPCPPVPKANPYERQAIRDYLQRTSPQTLSEFLGSKVDAEALLKQLREIEA